MVLYKLFKITFRANKLIKNPFKDGALLQLKLTLFKELVLSLSKKITNTGSNLYIFNSKNSYTKCLSSKAFKAFNLSSAK